jgi:hypothetical protein
MTTIIAKNPGGSDIGIEDLGLVVKAGEQRNLTELFSLDDITQSESLKTRVSAAQIVINDGTSDLSISDALDHLDVQTEWEDLGQDESITADRNVEGGVADSVYLPSQVVDGGDANG